MTRHRKICGDTAGLEVDVWNGAVAERLKVRTVSPRRSAEVEQGRIAGCVVVGTIVDPPMLGAEMVVVRTDSPDPEETPRASMVPELPM